MSGPQDARGDGGPGGYAGDGIEVPATEEPGTASDRKSIAEHDNEGAGGPGGYAGDGIEVPAQEA